MLRFVDIRTLREGVMLGKTVNWFFILTIIVAVFAAAASGQETAPTYDLSSNAGNDLAPGYQAISKVKAPAPVATKVKPYSGLTSRFDALSRFNPVSWGPDCYLPVPAQGQFVLGPSFWFARVQGEVRHGGPTAGATTVSTVDFDDHLGFKKSGNLIWSIEAMYQFRPRWGIRYSFMPVTMEATHAPAAAFNFGGNSFTGGSTIRSKFEHYEHRAGLVFHLSHTANALTSVFADWLHVQDKLTIGGVGTATTSVTWDTTKNLAVLGLEFNKCLKNYRGNTLAIGGKGGVAFLNDTFGWEAELALSYLIPIRTGRFGFVKGGYRYTDMRREKHSLMDITLDGPFVQVGFLF
jgi:hypothetical protein